MQPAQAASVGRSSGGNRQLKRWGPIVGVVAVVAIGVVIIVATSRRRRRRRSSARATTPLRQHDRRRRRRRRSRQRRPTPTTPDTDATRRRRPAASRPAPADDHLPAVVRAGRRAGHRRPDRLGRSLRHRRPAGWPCPTSSPGRAIAPFTGDNGGATAPGVTADEITVVYYEGQEADPIIAYITDAINVDDTNGEQFDDDEGASSATTRRTSSCTAARSTWSRSRAPAAPTDDVAARADAARIAEEFKPFVVLGGPALTSAFADELAARQIMCIGCTPASRRQFYVDRDPVRVGPRRQPGAEAGPHASSSSTKQLIGKNAEHGGDELRISPASSGCCTSRAAAPQGARRRVRRRHGGRWRAVRRGDRVRSSTRPRSRQPRRRRSPS